MSINKFQIFSDGGARGNPGPAGIGVVIKENGKTIRELKKYIGETTNNQAEYQALLLGLEEVNKIGVQEVECFLDSELVVKQLKGEYKVKNQDLAVVFAKVKKLLPNFKKCSFTHIRREKNSEADKLANEAIDQIIQLQ
jgi:ribonuclease HI